MPHDEATIQFLAGQFADLIHDNMTPEQFEEIKRLNRTEYAGGEICATHDFIDANEVMEAAFKQAFGRSPDGDYDMQLWNKAWDAAKKGWLS